jgi:hypothetical protein
MGHLTAKLAAMMASAAGAQCAPGQQHRMTRQQSTRSGQSVCPSSPVLAVRRFAIQWRARGFAEEGGRSGMLSRWDDDAV